MRCQHDLSTVANLSPAATATVERHRRITAVARCFFSANTPTWFLGASLFLCAFLPAYEGCNGTAIVPVRVLVEAPFDWDELFARCMFLFPYLFGLWASVGTLWGLIRARPEAFFWTWLGYAILLFLGLAAWILTLIASGVFHRPGELFQDFGAFSWFLIPITGLAICAALTAWRSSHWYRAAICLQLAMAVSAVASLTFLLPAIALARSMLVGGKLAIGISVVLVLSSLLQLADGYRSMQREATESPLQVSLSTMFILMTASGFALAWIGWFALNLP